MTMGEVVRPGPKKTISILKEKGKLISELCHFTQDLNPLWPASETVFLMKTLSLPYHERISQIEDQEKIVEIASRYFFSELGFKIVSPEEISLTRSFLPEVLNQRKGPPSLLMLLFSSLLEDSGIKVQITSCRKRHLLKLQLNGSARMVDFMNHCKPMSPDDIVDLINRGFDFSGGGLESDTLVVEYLNHLKRKARVENKLQILSLVHSYLMRYQPFNLRHLSERAVVAYETGDYKTAVDDIRSYFQYKQPEFTNLDLKRIYKVALRKERQLKSKVSNAFSDTIKGL